MILTVTLNSAVDKTYTVPNFALDKVHRPCEWRIVPGGKGINVSRVLRVLGMESVALGFAGGYNGGFIRSGLEQEGIAHDLVQTEGESRVCITIIDPEHGTQTEINENGPEIKESELAELNNRLLKRLPDAEGLVLSGSIPPGVPDDIYANWARAAKDAGVWTLLDSSGTALKLGVSAAPNTIKPNIHELAGLVGKELYTTEEILESATDLLLQGIETVLVSMGRSGALAVNKEEAWIASPPEIDFISAVGSGDAFVAGFLFGRHHSYDLPESLRISTAAGAANAMNFGAGFCTEECIHSLAVQVEVRNLVGEPLTG